MNAHWKISDAYKDTDVGRFFSSLDTVFNCKGEVVSSDLISLVKRVRVGRSDYFVKTYTSAGKRLRRFFGRSRLRAEWENLLLLRSLKIPTADLVGFGEQRNFGVFRRGALITKGIEGAVDLHQLARDHPELTQNRRWFSSIIHQVANYTRKMHEARFTHNDLNWRNILIKATDKPEIFFIDCPSGRVCYPPFLKRRIMRDLAHLDKVGRYILPKVSLLNFYKSYTGRRRLSISDKKTIKKILGYHDKHRERKQKQLQLSQSNSAHAKAKASLK